MVIEIRNIECTSASECVHPLALWQHQRKLRVGFADEPAATLTQANQLSARLDAVSATMLAMIAMIGWVVLRYAGTFLDGEERQGPFTGWVPTTPVVIERVQLLEPVAP